MKFTRYSNSLNTISITDHKNSQWFTQAKPMNNTTSYHVPDATMVWSMEENWQQKGGLPLVFIFVFLICRRSLDESADGLYVSDEAQRVNGGLDGVAANTSQR
jgi:hypothetical protein